MKNDKPSDGPRDSHHDDALVKAGLRAPPMFGTAGKYMGLGFQFGGSILLFLWIGSWLDKRFGTNGLFVLLGVFIGAGAAFYSMYRSLMADQRREEAELAEKKRVDAEQERGS